MLQRSRPRMGFGSKLGRSLLRLAQTGKEIDEGLNDLLGKDRIRPGDGFSSKRTAKKTEGIIKGSRNKDKLSLSNGKNKKRKFY